MNFSKKLAVAGLAAVLSLGTFGAYAQETTGTSAASNSEGAASALYELEPGTVLGYETQALLKMVGPATRSNELTFFETFTVLAKKEGVLTVLASIDAETSNGTEMERMPVTRFSFEMPVAGAGPTDTFKTSHEITMPHPLWQVESFFPSIGDEGATTRTVAVEALQHIAELPAVVTVQGNSTKLVVSSDGMDENQINYQSVSTFDGDINALSDRLTSVTSKAPAPNNMTLFLELDSKRTSVSKVETSKLQELQNDVTAGVAIARELSGFNLQQDMDKTDALVAKMDEYLKKYPEGAFQELLSVTRDNLVQVVERTNNASKITDGSEAPDFTATTLDGKEIKLSQYKGKTVLLDFWATWCQPCVMEMPNLKEIHDKYTTQGLVIIGISADESKEDLEEFVKAQNIKWPQIYDGEGTSNTLQIQYGISMYPTMIVVNKEGKIITVPPMVRGEALSTFIGEVLDGKPPQAKQDEAFGAQGGGPGQPVVIPVE